MTAPLLEITSLSKYFGGNAAVSDVSFSVEKQRIVGLIGPNGSGKTTLFNCITGYYPAASGRVRFCGCDITGMKPDRVCRLGMVRTWQRVKPLAGLNVLENVMTGAFCRTRSASEARKIALHRLEMLGLDNVAQKTAGDLPIGLKKKLELARALATGPKLLLLDEVCGGLNFTETQELLEIIRGIREKGTAVVFIEHDMKAVTGLCDRIVVLKSGEKLAEGLPSEITSNPAVIAAYLGTGYSHA
ncbi:MAG: ABC transporter ATP-binding protein [Chlorobiaceae bacterium]|nr:ABC transporter ATP-binding protein [Chlorobiaceae bacterium]